MISYRGKKENLKKLNNINWYKQCKGCESIVINQAYATTRSNYFRVDVVSELKGQSLNLTAVLYRMRPKNKQNWVTKLLYIQGS